MKVVTAINGSIVSQSCAFLALNYAKVQDIDLVLLHVKNDKDSIDDVNQSSVELEKAAKAMGMSCETVLLTGNHKKAIPAYCQSIHVDTFFCSTRVQNTFITNSFSEHVLKMRLSTNIAIVRIVHAHHFKELSSIVLPIKETRLSIYKFTFLASLASAYQSDTHIYSVTIKSNNELSKFTLTSLRERLNQINFELRHYINLSRLMPFKLNIKHEFSTDETQSILGYIASHDSPLAIIGAKRFTFLSLFRGEQPIEKIMRETSSNLIAFYPKEN